MLVVSYNAFADFKASLSGLLNLQKYFVDQGGGVVLCCHTSTGSGITHRFNGTQAQTDSWFLTANEVDGLNL